MNRTSVSPDKDEAHHGTADSGPATAFIEDSNQVCPRTQYRGQYYAPKSGNYAML